MTYWGEGGKGEGRQVPLSANYFEMNASIRTCLQLMKDSQLIRTTWIDAQKFKRRLQLLLS
eukprot:scaffold23735_cov250-Cylindrotheca_fusiformis.AAC.2